MYTCNWLRTYNMKMIHIFVSDSGNIVLHPRTYCSVCSDDDVYSVLGWLLAIFPRRDPQLSNCSFIGRSMLADTKHMNLCKSCCINMICPYYSTSQTGSKPWQCMLNHLSDVKLLMSTSNQLTACFGTVGKVKGWICSALSLHHKPKEYTLSKASPMAQEKHD